MHNERIACDMGMWTQALLKGGEGETGHVKLGWYRQSGYRRGVR